MKVRYTLNAETTHPYLTNTSTLIGHMINYIMVLIINLIGHMINSIN